MRRRLNPGSPGNAKRGSRGRRQGESKRGLTRDYGFRSPVRSQWSRRSIQPEKSKDEREADRERRSRRAHAIATQIVARGIGLYPHVAVEACESWLKRTVETKAGAYIPVSRHEYGELVKWLRGGKREHKRGGVHRGSIRNEPEKPDVPIWERVEAGLLDPDPEEMCPFCGVTPPEDSMCFGGCP